MDKELEVMKRNLEQRVRISCLLVSCISLLVVCVIANKVHPLIGGENYADFMSGIQVGLLNKGLQFKESIAEYQL